MNFLSLQAISCSEMNVLHSVTVIHEARTSEVDMSELVAKDLKQGNR